MERNICVIDGPDGKKVVVINDIRFRGKRKINWDEVEKYLKQYVGQFYEIARTGDIIYIGRDLPDEYSGSEDSSRLKGTLAKAKANAAQGIPELIQIADNRSFQENYARKHNNDAKYGWYRFDSRFALPKYNIEDEIDSYNIFRVRMLIRHDIDGKLYLYDIINIKKETSTPLELNCTVANPLL